MEDPTLRVIVFCICIFIYILVQYMNNIWYMQRKAEVDDAEPKSAEVNCCRKQIEESIESLHRIRRSSTFPSRTDPCVAWYSWVTSQTLLELKSSMSTKANHGWITSKTSERKAIMFLLLVAVTLILFLRLPSHSQLLLFFECPLISSISW